MWLYQSASNKQGIRENPLVWCVTKVWLCAKAVVPAISASMGPMGVPCAIKAYRPYFSQNHTTAGIAMALAGVWRGRGHHRPCEWRLATQRPQCNGQNYTFCPITWLVQPRPAAVPNCAKSRARLEHGLVGRAERVQCAAFRCQPT